MTLRVVAGWWARRGTHLPVAAAIAVVTAATVLADAGGRPALLVPLVVLQAVTAAGDGCKAAIDAERWLASVGEIEASTATNW